MLCNPGVRLAHPFGIGRVDWAPNEPTIVHLDAMYERRGDVVGWSVGVVRRVLPRTEAAPDLIGPAEVYGVVGLRVVDIEGVDLRVGLTGTNSDMILRGAPGTRWTEDIATFARECAATDSVPLWTDEPLTNFEKAFLHEYGDDDHRVMASLGSALLRRSGVFYRISNAYSTHSWTGPFQEWKVEMVIRHDVAINHDSFLDVLTDSRWGLPLRMRKSNCTCQHSTSDGDCGSGHGCYFHLTFDNADHAVGLQLRFIHAIASGAEGQWCREGYARIGADPAWLCRVLPE